MLRELIICAALSCGMAEAASFELHVVKVCAPEDTPYVLAGSTLEFCILPDKVIDESGIVKAERYPAIARVILDMTPAAQERLLAVTTENVGHDLAVLFNGKMIFKAAIDGPLKLEKIQLSLKDAPDAVDALVDAFPGPKT